MKYKCLTLFPEMIENGLNTSIIGKAIKQGIIQLETWNIRDYTKDKHGSVDDYTYGGGAGMLMMAQPVYNAYLAAVDGEKIKNKKKSRKVRTIYVTPQGIPFSQKMAGELAQEEELVFLCGHYEGIDERVLEEIVTDYVSIGDYVLTGGELAVMVMIDAISRLVPGVLGNEVSAETESFHNDLLEYPQYTRPEEWNGKAVPKILLGGNHAEIEKWRLEKSIERTRIIRPDLYGKYQKKQDVIQRLLKNKRNNISMIENLRRGLADILYDDGENLILYSALDAMCMILTADEEKIENFIEIIPAKTEKLLFQYGGNARKISKMEDLIFQNVVEKIKQEAPNEIAYNSMVKSKSCSCSTDNSKENVKIKWIYSACYTQKNPLKVKFKDIRPEEGEEGVYALYLDGVKCAAVKAFGDGSIRVPRGCNDNLNEILPDSYLGKGLKGDLADEINSSLLAFLINQHLYNGFTPFLFVEPEDKEGVKLLQKMGLYFSDNEMMYIEWDLHMAKRIIWNETCDSVK